MNATKSLKETHPQKYYLKLLCKCVYYMGMGDCWYEKTYRSKTHKLLYGIWAFFINGFIIINTINELLANFKPDLFVKERNDLIQFTFAHPCLCLKYIILVFQKDRVRILLERIVEGTRSVYSSEEVDRASVKMAILYFLGMAVSSYGTVLFATVDGIWTHFNEGIPIRTEVVWYPTRSDSGVVVNILRIMIQIHWWCIVSNMLLVDSVSVFALTFVGYKFKLVRRYFDNLKKKTQDNIGTKSKSALMKEYENDFKIGVKLHEDALWCTRNVQYALGNTYSVHVVETTGVMVMNLVRLVVNERNLVFLVAVLTFTFCMALLAGAYFVVGGFLSYQASMVGTSVFHSGWDLVPMSKSLRCMVVVVFIRLSSLMRSSYSFFAVMY